MLQTLSLFVLQYTHLNVHLQWGYSAVSWGLLVGQSFPKGSFSPITLKLYSLVECSGEQNKSMAGGRVGADPAWWGEDGGSCTVQGLLLLVGNVC